MKTDVDTCLKEIADFYVENRREMKAPELEAILKKHCENEKEMEKFAHFLGTEPGQHRFKAILIERKGESKPTGSPPRTVGGTCYEDAWHFLLKQEEGQLVHGSVQLSAEGKRVEHAWVKLPTDYIWEPQTKQFFTIEDFKIFSPIEEAKYSTVEAAIMGARTRNFGPWTDAERKQFLKSSNPNVHIVSGFKIPTTRVSSLGFVELELPVARAVEALVDENPWSSGFHAALNQRWTIVFRGKISGRAVKAARAAGLEVSYRELLEGSGQFLTDVSLPSVGVTEIEKATEVFNKFAELYEGSSKPGEELDTFALGKELEKYTPGFKVEALEVPTPKFVQSIGEIDDTKKLIQLRLWKDATRGDALAILAHEYAHIKPGTTLVDKGLTETETWRRGETFAREWGVLPDYLKLARELVQFYNSRKIYPGVARGIEQWLTKRTSSTEKPSYPTSSLPIIHEATSENPDPTQFLPVEVPSAFPAGKPSVFNAQEKAQIDRFINEVPDKNDTMAINYWLDWGDRKVYLEGWIDKCLAGTGFPPMEGGEWDEKIDYMVRDTHKTLIEKEKERGLILIEGGFREFEAGTKAWLYGVTWGVYKLEGRVVE